MGTENNEIDLKVNANNEKSINLYLIIIFQRPIPR